jgi:hypothetical protein
MIGFGLPVNGREDIKKKKKKKKPRGDLSARLVRVGRNRRNVPTLVR